MKKERSVTIPIHRVIETCRCIDCTEILTTHKVVSEYDEEDSLIAHYEELKTQRNPKGGVRRA